MRMIGPRLDKQTAVSVSSEKAKKFLQRVQQGSCRSLCITHCISQEWEYRYVCNVERIETASIIRWL